MARVKAHVWYDRNGTIVAVGRATTAERQVTPLADQDYGVVEIEIDEERARDLHITHVVDVERGVLIESARRRGRP